MALLLTEEQTMLRDSARAYLSDNAPVGQLRELRDSHDARGFSASLWKGFADMGFTGTLVPEANAGSGLGHAEVGVVMQELGRHLTATPFLASSVVATTAIRLAGSAQQQAKLLEAMAVGQCIATLALDEHGKHRPQRVELRAVKSGNGWTLDGAKTFVLDAHVADLLIVAARTSGEPDDAHGVTLFLVQRAAAGVQVERLAMIDSHNAARVKFNEVAVHDDAVLGVPHEAAATLQVTLDAGRCAVAAELLGVADEAFARTVGYLKERKQFDRLIGEFQGLQHRAAMLYCDIELARAAVVHAWQKLDAHPTGASAAVSVAKARAGRSATLAVQEGVQMHGGMGMTDEFDMGLFMKRTRVLQELFGDANFHADLLARQRQY
jgi:alkylation response protein AidB-like acyl-CoA dehydrogenase